MPFNYSVFTKKVYVEISFSNCLHFCPTFLHHISKVWIPLFCFWSILILVTCASLHWKSYIAVFLLVTKFGSLLQLSLDITTATEWIELPLLPPFALPRLQGCSQDKKIEERKFPTSFNVQLLTTYQFKTLHTH